MTRNVVETDGLLVWVGRRSANFFSGYGILLRRGKHLGVYYPHSGYRDENLAKIQLETLKG